MENNNQELPKFYQTFIPILTFLADKNEALPQKIIKKQIKTKYYSELPVELLTKTTSIGGVNTLLDRIGWALSYLTLGGYLKRPSRGYYKITIKGKDAAKTGFLTIIELKNQPEYLEHIENRTQNASTNDDNLQEEDTPTDLISKGIDSIEKEIKLQLLEKLKQVDPFYFEKIIVDLFNAMGYGEATGTKKTNDGGIDGIVNEDKLGLGKIYIQAKRFNTNKVREKDIRNFIGAMSGDTSKGIFVTTSEFDGNAIEKAKSAHHKIKLINGVLLAKLMYDYGIGVQVKNIIKIKEIDDDFFDE